MHHNHEKYRDIFLLIYGTDTSAETIISSIVPSPCLRSQS